MRARPWTLFAHRLALALGQPDVDAMLARLSARQVARWAEYYQLEPWGEERADLRSGIIAATLVNLFTKKRVRPKDFMVVQPPARRQSTRQIASVFQAMASAGLGKWRNATSSSASPPTPAPSSEGCGEAGGP